MRGSNAIKALEAWAAPFLIVSGLALLAWAVGRAGGFGPCCRSRAASRTTGAFLVVFVPSLTAMVGFWATLALNIPDLSRYARDQKAQVWGQFLGLPTTMTLFSFIGVAVTSASAVIFGEPIWDPVRLLSRLENPAGGARGARSRCSSPRSPRTWPPTSWRRRTGSRTSGRRASTSRAAASSPGIIGIAIMPWRLLENADRYMGWLVAYSGFLGPIAGIFIADYWVVRRARLSLPDLYDSRGIYGRWNARASSRSRPASRWHSSGSSCRRCGRCTITPGSSGSRARSASM